MKNMKSKLFIKQKFNSDHSVSTYATFFEKLLFQYQVVEMLVFQKKIWEVLNE